MEMTKQAEARTTKYEASSEDYSNAFYSDEIKLFQIGNDCDEPRYELRDARNPRIYPLVSLPGDDYLHLCRVRARVFHACGIVPFPGIEQKEWLALVGKKADQGSITVERLPDYSLSLQIVTSVKQFWQQRERGSEPSDIQSGCYWLKEGENPKHLWFRPEPLRHWLHRDLGFPFKKRALTDALKPLELVADNNRVGKSNEQMWLWGVEVEKLNNYLGIEHEW